SASDTPVLRLVHSDGSLRNTRLIKLSLLLDTPETVNISSNLGHNPDLRAGSMDFTRSMESERLFFVCQSRKILLEHQFLLLLGQVVLGRVPCAVLHPEWQAHVSFQRGLDD